MLAFFVVISIILLIISYFFYAEFKNHNEKARLFIIRSSILNSMCDEIPEPNDKLYNDIKMDVCNSFKINDCEMVMHKNVLIYDLCELDRFNKRINHDHNSLKLLCDRYNLNISDINKEMKVIDLYIKVKANQSLKGSGQ
jgi:hypothetical protein